MVPILPVIVAAGAITAWWRHRKREMTLGQKTAFEGALKLVKDPDKLNRLADAFAKEGFKEHATLLRKRARLRVIATDPKLKNIKEGRKAALLKGLQSTDPEKVEKLAAAFEKEGATAAAEKLRDYAKGLRAGDVLKNELDEEDAERKVAAEEKAERNAAE